MTPNQLTWSRRCSISWLRCARSSILMSWASQMSLSMWKRPAEVHGTCNWSLYISVPTYYHPLQHQLHITFILLIKCVFLIIVTWKTAVHFELCMYCSYCMFLQFLLQFLQRHFRRTLSWWAVRSRAWKKIWRPSLLLKTTKIYLRRRCPYPFFQSHKHYNCSATKTVC